MPLVLLVAVSCAQPEPPVARLSVDPAEIGLAYPEFTRIGLTWKIERPLAGLEDRPRVFVHALDSSGKVVRTFDHVFPEPWRVGEEVRYEATLFQSALAPALEEGEYGLTFGLYDQAGNRWPLEVSGQEIHPQEYRAATLRAGARGEVPKFYFSPTWLPPEGGTDLQILARRWLGDDGVIRLSDIAAPGRLWVTIGIPEGRGELQELILEEEADEPVATIGASCGGFATQVTGSGSHILEIPVEPQDEGTGTDCEVTFTANFYLLSRDNMSRRLLALESLSWSASG
jgi:hypothetical protein